ncbi:MAG: hypothetical protein ABFS28_06630 [Bacteroidota bacterium]
MEIFDANTLFGFWPKKKADISLESLLSLMDENGISKAMTCSARGIFYDFIEGNSETLEVCKQHPQLNPVGTVNPCRWLGCADELESLINDGIKMIRFFPQFQEWHIGEAHFRKLLDDILSKSGTILMVPAVEGITAIGELAKNTDNPIIIEGCRYDRLAEAIVVMGQSSNIYLETQLINSPNFLELLKAEGCIEKLIYGSSAPLKYIGAAIAPVSYSRITEKEKTMVFSSNLKQLMEDIK